MKRVMRTQLKFRENGSWIVGKSVLNPLYVTPACDSSAENNINENYLLRDLAVKWVDEFQLWPDIKVDRASKLLSGASFKFDHQFTQYTVHGKWNEEKKIMDY